MPVRIIPGPEVDRLLPMPECIDAMADALGALADGRAALPLRTVIRFPGGQGAFAAMPARLERPEAFGLKAIAVWPGNEGTRWDSHQGVVLLFEPEHGTLAAILDGSRLTAIRTAAVSGLATRLLATDAAGDLAILGTGVQARTHLAAMQAVRSLRRVRAWSRHPASLQAFVTDAHHAGVEVEPCPSAEAAVRGADLVCTVTASPTPVLAGDWLAPGCHVNAVGASLPDTRELDSRAMARGRLFVDRRESAEHEAGDYLIPLAEGAIGEDHIAAELGEVVTGRHPGRAAPDEITIFKSLGLAVEDVAAAWLAHRRAVDQDAGLLVDLGGVRP